MASEQPSATADGVNEVDLAKAFQELAKGERAAALLESKVSEMEAKIEELLAQAEKEQNDVKKAREASINADGNATSS